MAKEATPSNILRRLRGESMWSQKQVADKIGTSKENVSCWERGVRLPSKHYQQKLCTLFDKTAEEFGFLETEEKELDTSPGSANPPPNLNPNTGAIVERIGETVVVSIAIHSSQFQALVQPLQNELQRGIAPLVVEASPHLVEVSTKEEVSVPSFDIHDEDIMKNNQNAEREPAYANGEGKDMNKERRNVTIALTGVPIWGMGLQDLNAEIQRLLLQPSSGPGDKELTYLEQKIRYYWQDRYNMIIVPADLVSHVVGYVQEVKTILKGSLIPSIRTRLCACLSQGMLLIGVNFYDAGQFQTARECYQTALKAAHEANNNILQSLVWNWDSYAWLYSNETNCDEHARDSMVKASHFASLEPDLAVQCSSQAGLADIYAYLNEKDTCLEALREASKPDGYGQGDYYHIHQFDQSHLNGYRGFCLQQCYQPGVPSTEYLLEESRQAIETALSQLNAVSLQRAFYTADMAQLYARKGEVESACNNARQIIGIAGTSVALRKKILMIRTHLEPYVNVGAVKELDRDIKASLLSEQQ